MSAPWPCSTCGAPGVRNVFAKGYCGAHLVDLFRMFQPSTWMRAGGGVGLPELMRPDVGPGFAELTCSCCAAGWVGAMFERCPWCQTTIANLARWRADEVLRPPDVDPDDARYDDRMRAWADRLATAVEADIVTEDEARRAWRQGTGGRRVAA